MYRFVEFFDFTTRRPHRGAVAALVAVFFASAMLTGCSGSSGGTAQDHVERAKTYRKEGKINASIIELKNALQMDPKMGEARWLLGNDYLAKGDGAAAEKELERAEKLGVKNPQLFVAQLRALLYQNKNQQVINKAEKAPKGTPEGALLAVRAEAELGLKHTDKARELLEKALRLRPNSIEVHLALARTDIAARDFPDADKYLGFVLHKDAKNWQALLLKGESKLAQGKPEESLVAFKQVLDVNGSNIFAELGVARALLTQKKPDDALKYIRKIEKQHPNNVAATYLHGYAAYVKGDFDTATDTLQRVLSAVPNNPQCLLLLANIQYRTAHLEQAADLLNRFRSVVPNYIPALKLGAAIQIRLHQPQQAIDVLQPIADSGQADAQALALLGTAETELGNYVKGNEYLQKAAKLAPDAANIRTQLALSHLASGATEQAVSELHTAVKLDPKLMQADILLVLAELNKKDFNAALNDAKALAAKHPKNPLPLNLQGAALVGQKDLPGARAAFEQAFKVDPKFTPALINLANLDLHEGKPDQARAHLDQALKIDPNNGQALMQLVRMDFAGGNPDDAIAALQHARSANPNALGPRLVLGDYYLRTDDLPKALAMAKEATSIAPQNKAALQLLGQVQLHQGDTQSAIATYEQLVKLADKSPAAYARLATAQAIGKQEDDARQSYKEALQLQPDFVPAIIGLGQLAYSEKNVEQALQYAREAQSAAPNKLDGLILEGDIYLAQKRPEAAEKTYQRALAKKRSSLLIAKLYRAQQAMGDHAAAAKTVKDWLAAHPKDAAIRLMLADNYQQQGNTDGAIAEYEAVLEANKNNIPAMNNLAWLYMQRNDPRAEELAKRAYTLMPGRPEIQDTYGWILVKRNNVERGVELLQKAAAAAPNSPEIAYHLAAGWAKSGDKRQARTALQNVLKKFKQFPDRRDAEALLKQLD